MPNLPFLHPRMPDVGSPHLSLTSAALAALPMAAGAAVGQIARHWGGLGPVLWLWRAASGQALDLASITGWTCMHRVGPDGICEALRFYTRDRIECVRLYLLPDSDYLVWERLLGGIACDDGGATRDLHQHLRNAAWSQLGPRWQAAIVRFHHVADACEEWLLAAPAGAISAPGLRRAAEICQALDAYTAQPVAA